MKRQTRLFPKALTALARLGENIKLARRRRGITSALMAERANLSLMTLRAIERGSPKVAMGNYMSVLFCLGMQDDNYSCTQSEPDLRHSECRCPQQIRQTGREQT